jgi:hypothetical protein
MSNSCDTNRRQIEGPAAATISSLPDAGLHYCFFHLLVQVTIDMLLELLVGFKISKESSTKARRGGKARLLPFHASPNLLCFRDERKQRWDGRPNVRVLNSVARRVSREAASNGQLQVLDWLWNNGFDHDMIKCTAVRIAAKRGFMTKDGGYVFTDHRNRHICLIAAIHGNLPALQCLRQNGCPWDVGVITTARAGGHEDVAAWAIANGCPEV